MKNEFDFEKQMQRLDQIVDALSSETLPFDESIKLYEEGQKIIISLEEQLKQAEDKIEKVINTKTNK